MSLIFSQPLNCDSRLLFLSERERRAGGKVLVHCHGGISRSATVCLAYLMFSRHLRLDDAFDYVRARRHVISPNANFMMQLSQFETELRKLGVCWPAAWSQRYPSSSSSTTTEEEMSWEGHHNRLESSSSTTSSELSWQGSFRGGTETVTGHHCPDSGLSLPQIQDQQQQESAPNSQSSISLVKRTVCDSTTGKTFDSSTQSINQFTESQKLNSDSHLNLQSSEDVFFQQLPEIRLAVHHQDVSPKSPSSQNHEHPKIENVSDINFSSLSPPPKSPSLNFGCLHEQAKSGGQNFFFGSCPDITRVNHSETATTPGQKNKNEETLDNGLNGNVFSYEPQPAKGEEGLSFVEGGSSNA